MVHVGSARMESVGEAIYRRKPRQRSALSLTLLSMTRHRVVGFPANDIQVYELYNTKPQIAARTHPAILRTQQELLQLWHDPSNKHVSFSTPISYFDRLRIRTPGDRSFTVGPHIDGGSVERWEDPTFRRVFRRILAGGAGWKSHDPFDVSWRMDAKQDLYGAP